MEATLRKNWIDWAKALGILLVVMGHSNYSQQDIIPMIFMIHMPLFFVASGYLFKTNKTLKEITQSNIRTLLIPYLLFNLISLVYLSGSTFVKQVTGADVDWNGQIFQPMCDTLLGVPGNLLCGPTWFLLALIWCKYIIYGIEKSKPTVGFFITFLWLVVLVTIQFVDVKLPLSIGGGTSGCLWFAVGYYIKKYSRRICVNKWIWAFAIPLAFVVCLYICRLQGNCNYLIGDLKGWLGLVGTSAGLVAFYGICNLLNRFRLKLITLVSQASIVTMCLHLLVMPNLEKVTHYQYHLGITLVGDIFIVLLLTAIYPLLKKHAPYLVGYRK